MRSAPRLALVVLVSSSATLGACGAAPERHVVAPAPKPVASAGSAPTTTIADVPRVAPEKRPSPRVRELREEARVVAWERKGDEEVFCLTSPANPADWEHWTGASPGARVDVVAVPPSVVVGSAACHFVAHVLAKTPVTELTLEGWSNPAPTWDTKRGVASGTDMVHLRLAVPSARPSRKGALDVWPQALSSSFARVDDAFARFARHRLDEMTAPAVKGKGPGRAPTGDPVWSAGALARTMDWFTGADAIQSALENERPLLRAGGLGPAKVDVATLKGPELETYPWARMTAALGVAPRPEPLAELVPAEFHYARFSSLTTLLDVLDEAEPWMKVRGFGDDEAWSREIATRYPTELGLERSPLTRALGDAVVSEVALVGSDPYWRDGTDVTLLFRVRQKDALRAALARSAATLGNAHGGFTVEEREGMEIARSADGQMRSHRAWLREDVLAVSNSAGALRRVSAAAAAKAPRLSDEPDLAYMLAREVATAKPGAAKPDVFAFLGERFVRAVSGPAQKIAAARRQRALFDLRAPGFAEALFGILRGRPPASTDELLSARVLRKDELAHVDGEPIRFAPREAAASSWGTVRTLLPLLERPTPVKVTEAEAEAYRRFAAMYRDAYEHYIDPIAITGRIRTEGAARVVDYDVRVLPPGKDRLSHDERILLRELGLGRVKDVRVGDGGVHVTVGVGEGSKLRRELTQLAHVPMLGKLSTDWLGDWARIGTFDTNAIYNFVASETHGRDVERVLEWPVYAAIAVKNKGAAALVLAGLKHSLSTSSAGAITWERAFEHAGAEVVRVGEKAEEGGRRGGKELEVYYAFKGDMLLVATRADVIKRVLEMAASGSFATGEQDAVLGKDSENLALDAALGEDSPLRGALELLARGELLDERGSASAARVIYRAFPAASDPAVFDAEARRVFGDVPRPVGGTHFGWGARGLTDEKGRPLAERSQAIRDELALPTSRVRGLSFRLSFDREPEAVVDGEPARSLHVNGSVRLAR